MQLLWLRTDEDIEIRNSHNSIIIDSGLKILIFLGGGSRSDTIWEPYRNVVNNSQLQEIFCMLYHHSRVRGIVVYCVWHSDYNNDSIILYHNKRSMISTDIIKCQNCREQVRYFVHIMQR